MSRRPSAQDYWDAYEASLEPPPGSSARNLKRIRRRLARAMADTSAHFLFCSLNRGMFSNKRANKGWLPTSGFSSEETGYRQKIDRRNRADLGAGTSKTAPTWRGYAPFGCIRANKDPT